MRPGLKLKKMPQPVIPAERQRGDEKWCYGWLVTFPVSIRYNGGITIDGEWYDGYEVPEPKVPEGFELISIACGLQLNAHPPYATMYLKPKEADDAGTD